MRGVMASRGDWGCGCMKEQDGTFGFGLPAAVEYLHAQDKGVPQGNIPITPSDSSLPVSGLTSPVYEGKSSLGASETLGAAIAREIPNPSSRSSTEERP